MPNPPEKDNEHKPIGGLAFFCSLFFLIFLALINLSILPKLWSGFAAKRILFFCLGCIPGAWLAASLITGHLSVFFHEFKHKLISGLVGNKPRRLKVKKDHGAFEYEYTSRTAAYNAFIALAPYWVPLFTVLTLILGLAFWRSDTTALMLGVGLGFGADAIMNGRDISAHQTDLTNIRGGYKIGLLYVIAMNAALLSLLLLWVMADIEGLLKVVQSLGRFVGFLLGKF